MPNVLLTQKCVRSCPYCFAQRHMSSSPPDDVITWENLIYIADFLAAAGERRFPMLGGEPTLHGDFVDMVLYVIERGFEVTVFTSGVMSDAMLESAAAAFAGLPPEKLGFVCNLNDPEQTRTPPAELAAVKRFLRRFGERVVPGFNIYRTDYRLDFLFDYVNEFGLRRHLRLGVAHPIAGTNNRHIAIGDMRAVVLRLFEYRDRFEAYRIKPGLDCGFPMCQFTNDELAWMYRNTPNRYDFGCAPVIDIGPDLSVWSCFPLSSFHRRSLLEFNSLRELHAYYESLHRKVRIEVAGLYPECDSCVARDEGLCRAGCVAHALRSFAGEARVRMKEVYL
jgi:hypothetical protein